MKRLMTLAGVLAVCVSFVQAADKAKDPPKDTTKAAAARKLLKTKVTVEYKETRLGDVVDDLKEQIPKLGIRIDTKGGVSQNQTVTFKADDKPLDEVLDGMFKKNDLGYIIVSKQNDAYDGTLLIKKGKERGFPSDK